MKSQFLSQSVLLSLSLSFASSLAAGERRLSLDDYRDKTIELVNEPTGWKCEAAVWQDIRITANNGTL